MVDALFENSLDIFLLVFYKHIVHDNQRYLVLICGSFDPKTSQTQT